MLIPLPDFDELLSMTIIVDFQKMVLEEAA
jgi:hypothetical protein